MLYDKLVQKLQNQHEALKKLSDWMFNLHSSNKSDFATRIAFEDGTWWLLNGLADDYVRFEGSLGKHLQNNLSILCGYDVSNLNELYIEAIIASHIYSNTSNHPVDCNYRRQQNSLKCKQILLLPVRDK